MHFLRCLLLTLCAACAFSPARADVLSLETNAAQDTPRPTRGLTMRQVEQRFGAPREKLPAVGAPPITRWEYDNFTVYFEHQYVLHSVVHHSVNK